MDECERTLRLFQAERIVVGSTGQLRTAAEVNRLALEMSDR